MLIQFDRLESRQATCVFSKSNRQCVGSILEKQVKIRNTIKLPPTSDMSFKREGSEGSPPIVRVESSDGTSSQQPNQPAGGGGNVFTSLMKK